MVFPRTPKVLEDYKARLTRPHFGPGRRLTVEFEMEPDQYLALLPPLMDPVEGYRAVVGIGQWESNSIGPYNGGSLSLIASHQGVVGGVAVNMWMDSEVAVQFGRDVLGEPKKLALSGLSVAGGHARAWIERHGVRIIEIAAELGDDAGPSEVSRLSFNYRSRPSVDGFHLTEPITLTKTTFATSIRVQRFGSGDVMLRSTPHDLLGRILVKRIVRAEYQEHDILANTEAIASVSAEEYLPFHYGKLDDFSALS